MAYLVYNYAKTKLITGQIDLDADDIRVLLVKVAASTTCDTEVNAQTISGFTTLGEISATNYVRKALASEVVNTDTSNNRAEFDAADVTWTALGGASNDTIGGYVIYKHVTNDTDSIPILYNEFASSQATNGGDIVVQWNSEGILQAA